MRPQKLVWRIYFVFLAATLLALAAVAWNAARAFREFHQNHTAEVLLARARIIAQGLEQEPAADPARMDALCKELGRLSATRISIILPDGRVVGDTEEIPADMENHRRRPEVAAALDGREGQAVRYSNTLRRNLMYVAVPAVHAGQVTAIVRTALPLADVQWTLSAVYRHIAAGVAAAALLFAVIALGLSHRISRPLSEMRAAAERMSQGELDTSVAEAGGDEIGALARALNRMARALRERMETIDRQRSEQAAVLAGMAEGVLALDGDGRIIQINRAAERLLECLPGQARGRMLQEIARNPQLQEFAAATLAARTPEETEIVLHGPQDIFLQLHGAALQDHAGRQIGAVIVLNDISRLKRLENMRRDFVANVSHELKTPITAIKGCVETLTDNAAAGGAEAERFMAMLARHTRRLEAIVEDLLNLSRIEFDAERQNIPLEPTAVAGVLRRAVDALAAAAAAKRIAIALVCPDGLAAPINAPLLETAVVNLLSNAVKFSGPDTRVEVRAETTQGRLAISVADQGQGIEARHLPRIFERFYRVDQARSRALGGTGLGLAIVKHIALAHRGSASVASTPGAGSIFTITIPQA